jgi:hypothetical protein
VTHEMAVWCDDASHPLKRPRVFVGTFTRSTSGRLMVDNERRRTKGAAAVWLREDDLMGPVESDGARHGENVGRDELDRLRVRLVCRRCKRPLTVRTGKFDAALDQLADVGRVYATMSELRAILGASGTF